MDKNEILHYKKKREEQGISMEDLSSFLGVSYGYIGKVEDNGENFTKFVYDNYKYYIDNFESIASLQFSDVKNSILGMKGAMLIATTKEFNKRLCKINSFYNDYFVIEFLDDKYYSKYKESYTYNDLKLRRILLAVKSEQEQCHKLKSDNSSLLIKCRKDYNNIKNVNQINLKSQDIQYLCDRLSVDETEFIINCIKKTNNNAELLHLKNKLFYGHIYLVSIVTRRLIRNKFADYSYIELDDLFQVGCQYLWRFIDELLCVKAFLNKDSDYYFKSIINKKIYYSLLDYSREIMPTKVTATTQSHYIEIRKSIEELTFKYLREPTTKEISAHIKKSIEHVSKFRSLYSSITYLDSEDKGINNEIDGLSVNDDLDLYDIINYYPINPEKILTKILLENALSKLSQQEKKYIDLKFNKSLGKEDISKLLSMPIHNLTKYQNEIFIKLKHDFVGYDTEHQKSKVNKEEENKITILRNVFYSEKSVDRNLSQFDSVINSLNENEKFYLQEVYVMKTPKTKVQTLLKRKNAKISERVLLKKIRDIFKSLNPDENILSDLKYKGNTDVDVKSLLELLPDDSKKFFISRYYKQLSLEDILSEFNMAMTTYYRLRERSFKELKKLINQHILQNGDK